MATFIAPERPDTPDATALVGELEAHLASWYPDESRFGYAVEKLIEQQVAFFVAREDGQAAGCGGIQLFGDGYGELKRMYVRPALRGRGIGRQLLETLAGHARSHGVTLLRLETGIHQEEAIALYTAFGFEARGPFGDYGHEPLSLFMEMRLP